MVFLLFMQVQDEAEAALIVILLKFMYTGDLVCSNGVPCTSRQCLQLLLLADKFGVERYKKQTNKQKHCCLSERKT